jgi:chemotaxis protein methyltransferase CheR
MTMARTIDVASWDCAVLATDISTRALAKARAGIYPGERVEGLGEAERALALARQGSAWRVRDELRAFVHFARLNLMDATWPMHGPFDAIFCRNVMIYFDTPTQERLVRRLAVLLRPGGTLYIGHAETLNGIDQPLKAIAPAVYVRPG